MRQIVNINDNWTFIKSNVDIQTAQSAEGENIDIPFTWNNIDGQDGGNDYVRDAFWFVKKFEKPKFEKDETVYLEFKGVNSSSEIWLNGNLITSHDGGYSTFRVEIKEFLQDNNVLCVKTDNSKTEKVYPQTADFTFYGGIYRDVNILIVNENHFDLDFYGAPGIKVDASVKDSDGIVTVTAYVKGGGTPKISILDSDENIVATGESGQPITIQSAHLWNGIQDPYLYKAKAELVVDEKSVDEVTLNFGFRYYSVDPKKGFFLNGKSYPLRVVCRH